MQLPSDQSPFPENEACKKCMLKPCRELFRGRVYPGKMIFVHRREFMSWPCHQPDFLKQKEETETAAALTDDIEVITGSVEINNPRWEPHEEANEEGDKEHTLMGDTIRLLVDVKNYPDGASVSFDIYDVTESPPLRIATVNGKNEQGTASALWTVEDPQKRGEALKLQFEASAKGRYTQKTDIPWRDKFHCHFVEMPDVLFHHNSALPCIDEEGILVGALVATSQFAKEHPDSEVVLFGHTDTSGDPSYNYDLSGWRAEAVRALLDGDAQLWLDMVDVASKVEDYQTILATLASHTEWSCDPGSVDNTNGPATRAAVKTFQEEYNGKFSGDLEPDGIMGPKTWEALFVVIRSIVTKAVEADIGKSTLPALTYGYNGSGVYPCGESFPIEEARKDDYRSASNRRVEIVFFDKGKAPKLSAPVDKKKVEKREDPSHDPKKTDRKNIPVNANKPVVSPESEVILYDPEKNEYWQLGEPAEVDKLITEAEYMNEFALRIRDAWEKPTFREQCDASTSIEKEFRNVIGDKQLAKGSRAVKELLAVKTNGRFAGRLRSMVYIRNHIRDRNGNPVEIRGHWRKHSKKYMEEKLGEFLRLDEKSKNKPEYKTKATFWKKDFDDRSAFRFNESFAEGSDCFSACAEAQMLRFAAGASVNAEMDLKKGTLKIGGEGNLTLSLAEGTVTGGLYLPDKQGLNLLAIFASNDKLCELVKAGRACLVRISLNVNGYAFAGVSVTAFIGLPNIDFRTDEKASKQKSDAELGAEAGAGATATVGGTIAPELAWKDHDDPAWRKLASVIGRAEGSLGLAVNARASISFTGGKFRCRFALGAVVGLGGKLGVDFELGVAEGFGFITYILSSLDYHFVVEITPEAFGLLVRISIARITDVTEVIGEVASQGKELVMKAFKKGKKGGLESKEKMVTAIINQEHSGNFRSAVPEAQAAILLGIMEFPQEQDFEAILTVLRATGYHELKSVLRELSEMKLDREAPDYKIKQGIALQEGVRRLMEFGKDVTNYDRYIERLLEIFKGQQIEIQ